MSWMNAKREQTIASIAKFMEADTYMGPHAKILSDYLSTKNSNCHVCELCWYLLSQLGQKVGISITNKGFDWNSTAYYLKFVDLSRLPGKIVLCSGRIEGYQQRDYKHVTYRCPVYSQRFTINVNKIKAFQNQACLLSDGTLIRFGEAHG